MNQQPKFPAAIARHLPPAEVLNQFAAFEPESKTQMIDTVYGWADRVADRMRVEVGQRQLRESVKRCLGDGTLSTMQVIQAAAQYREIDLALREVLAEGLDLPGDVVSTTALRYLQGAVLRDITTDPAGHNLGNFNRDIGIACLMVLTMVRWPYLKKSANPTSKASSASFIVAEALRRRGITTIKHGRVLEIYNDFDLIIENLTGMIPAAA